LKVFSIEQLALIYLTPM